MILLKFLILACGVTAMFRLLLWAYHLPPTKCDTCGANIGTNGSCQNCREWWR